MISRTSPHDRTRHLLFVTTPALWPAWPFLPVIRRSAGTEELGVMADVLGLAGLTGFKATVFKVNLYSLPERLDEFLTLPKEVFDSSEELVASGWSVD